MGLQAFRVEKAAADRAFADARYEEAARTYKRAADVAPSPDLQAACLKDAGVALRLRGDIPEAEKVAHHARTLLQDERSCLSAEIALLIGNCLADRSAFASARSELSTAAEMFRAFHDFTGYAQSLLAHARVLAETGATDESIQFYEQLLALRLPPAFQTQVLNNLGLLYRRLGDTDSALALMSRDIRLCRASGDIYGEAVALYNSATTLLDAHRTAEALTQFAEAADRFDRIGRTQERDQALALSAGLFEN